VFRLAKKMLYIKKVLVKVLVKNALGDYDDFKKYENIKLSCV
jgi:hypothetical protein